MDIVKHKHKLTLQRVKRHSVGSLQKLQTSSKRHKKLRKPRSGHALKAAQSQNSVIYLDTYYLSQIKNDSLIDLTHSDTDMVLTKHEKDTQNRHSLNSMRSKSIVTIQSIHKLSCASSEEIGLAHLAKNIFLNTNVYNYYEPNKIPKETSNNTTSGIHLRRTYPFTSVTNMDLLKVSKDGDSNENKMSQDKLLFIYDVAHKMSDQSTVPSEGDPELYTLDIGMLMDLYKAPYDKLSP